MLLKCYDRALPNSLALSERYAPEGENRNFGAIIVARENVGFENHPGRANASTILIKKFPSFCLLQGKWQVFPAI